MPSVSIIKHKLMGLPYFSIFASFMDQRQKSKPKSTFNSIQATHVLTMKLTFKTHESEVIKFKLNKVKISSLRKKKNQSKTINKS